MLILLSHLHADVLIMHLLSSNECSISASLCRPSRVAHLPLEAVPALGGAARWYHVLLRARMRMRHQASPPGLLQPQPLLLCCSRLRQRLRCREAVALAMTSTSRTRLGRTSHLDNFTSAHQNPHQCCCHCCSLSPSPSSEVLEVAMLAMVLIHYCNTLQSQHAGYDLERSAERMLPWISVIC